MDLVARVLDGILLGGLFAGGVCDIRYLDHAQRDRSLVSREI